MKIITRMSLAFGFIIVLMGAVAVTSYRDLDQLVADVELINHTHEIIENIEVFLTLAVDLEAGQRGFVLTGEERYLEPYDAALLAIEPELQVIRSLLSDDPSQLENLDSIAVLLAAKEAELAETIDLRRNVGFDAALAVVVTDVGKVIMDELRAILAEMETYERVLLEEETLAEIEDVARTQFVIVWGSATVVVVVLLVGVTIGRSLSNSIGGVLGGLEAIGRGDLSHRLDDSGQDEIGQVAKAANHMAGRLEETQADLVGKEEMETVFETVIEVAARLGSASTEILAAVTDQASTVEEQAVSVAETMSTVDEISQTADQAAERAKSVSDQSGRSLELGREGKEVVELTVTNMTSVREQSVSAATSIRELTDKAEAIGEIITTVNEIADQTNLLALNAAIEASRAGEHGKGFSVVAGEVKALAEQSKRATGQVRRILSEIQKASSGAVAVTERTTTAVEETFTVVQRAGSTINELSEALTTAAGAATQISASVEQQSVGLTQINQAVQEINKASAQSQVATTQTKSAAEELTQLAAELMGLTQNGSKA